MTPTTYFLYQNTTLVHPPFHPEVTVCTGVLSWCWDLGGVTIIQMTPKLRWFDLGFFGLVGCYLSDGMGVIYT